MIKYLSLLALAGLSAGPYIDRDNSGDEILSRDIDYMPEGMYRDIDFVVPRDGEYLVSLQSRDSVPEGAFELSMACDGSAEQCAVPSYGTACRD